MNNLVFFFTALVVSVVGSLLLGLPVKALWNWIMPGLFNVGTLTFWKACGLMLLIQLFFNHPNMNRDKE